MEHPWLAEGYDQPIRIPIPNPEAVPVSETILKQMVAMGYPYASTHKVVTDNIASPALMVYQRMLQQMEEDKAFPPKVIPASPHKAHIRRASANAVLSPRGIAVADVPVTLRAISDPKRVVKAKRRSCEIPAQFLQAALQSPPPSSRPTLTSSWRISQMSTISEEVPIATENASDIDPITILHRKLPQLHLTPHHSSAPNSPRSPPILSPFTEEIPIVRGAFNVATTTLKPRRALLEEIGRALTESGIEYSLQRTTFECSVGEQAETPREKASTRGYFDDEEKGTKSEDDEDTTFGRLRFDIEVCRVAGLEMLLAVRFRRIVGNSWEYQEICKNLMAKMKL